MASIKRYGTQPARSVVLPGAPVVSPVMPNSRADEKIQKAQDRMGFGQFARPARPVSPGLANTSPGSQALDPVSVIEGQARALDLGPRTLRGRLVEKITVTRPMIFYPIDVLATGGTFFQTVGVNGGFGVDASPILARGSGIVFHSPNKIDQANPTANNLRSVGSGVAFFSAPGDWYVYYDVPFTQATAVGMLTYLLIDASLPGVARHYLSLPGIHYFNKGTVSFTGTDGATLSSTGKSYRDRKAITFCNASQAGDAVVPLFLQPYYNQAPPAQSANEGFPLFPAIAASPSSLTSITFADSTISKAAFTERVEGIAAAKLYIIEYY